MRTRATFLAITTLLVAGRAHAADESPSPVASADGTTPLHGSGAAPEPESSTLRVLEAGAPAPDGYEAKRQTRSDLIVAGASLAGSMYGTSVMVAAACAAFSCAARGSARPLFVPLVGPFVQMAWTEKPVGNVFLAIDGLAQLAGVGMIVGAVVFRREVLVPIAGHARVTLVPVVGAGRSGLSLVGVF